MQVDFFPSRTVTLYLAKLFIVRILAVLVMLVIVLQLLDLLGQSGQILAYPGNSEAQLWYYVSLRAPQLVARFLPYSVLLATIITLATLNQNSEVVAMKAAGMSAHQVLAPLLLTALAVSVVSFAFNERIVTRSPAAIRRAHERLPSDRHGHPRGPDGAGVGRCDDDAGRDVLQARRERHDPRTDPQSAGDLCQPRLAARKPDPLQCERGVRDENSAVGRRPGADAGQSGDQRGRRRRPERDRAPAIDRSAIRCRPPHRRAPQQMVAQVLGFVVVSADAAARRGGGVRPRALGPIVRPRGDRHGAGVHLFRGRQCRAGVGRLRRLPAADRRLDADPAVHPGRRDGADPHRGIEDPALSGPGSCSGRSASPTPPCPYGSPRDR